VDLDDWTASLVAAGNPVARDDDLTGYSVKRIVFALTPVKAPSHRNRESTRGRETKRRRSANGFVRTEELRATDVDSKRRTIAVRGMARTCVVRSAGYRWGRRRGDRRQHDTIFGSSSSTRPTGSTW